MDSCFAPDGEEEDVESAAKPAEQLQELVPPPSKLVDTRSMPPQSDPEASDCRVAVDERGAALERQICDRSDDPDTLKLASCLVPEGKEEDFASVVKPAKQLQRLALSPSKSVDFRSVADRFESEACPSQVDLGGKSSKNGESKVIAALERHVSDYTTLMWQAMLALDANHSKLRDKIHDKLDHLFGEVEEPVVWEAGDAPAPSVLRGPGVQDGKPVVPLVSHSQPCVEAEAVPVGAASPEDDAFLHGVVAYARLRGLKTSALNGAAGQVLGFDTKAGRWQVQLFGSTKPKLFKRENLVPYVPSMDDRCTRCLQSFNLFSIPPCGCSRRKLS